MPGAAVTPLATTTLVITPDISEQLLRVLGSVLDIRRVFPQVSSIANEVLPHDRLTMTLLDGGQTGIAHAASNDDGPTLVKATGPSLENLVEGFSRIIDDLRLEPSTLTSSDP